MEDEGREVSGFLPIDLVFRGDKPHVRWMELEPSELSEPFFFQTVARKRRCLPPAHERDTAVDLLRYVGSRSSAARPAGVICHISRCGSTLIGNALRAAGARVVSEAAPVEALFAPYASAIWPFPLDLWEAMRGELLSSLAAVFGRDTRNTDESPVKLVIKFSSPCILALPFIRSVWPEVPCLIVTRDPIEVIISNLQAPGGWLRAKNKPLTASNWLGLGDLDLTNMTSVEYRARVVGSFCEAAINNWWAACKVLDYKDLNEASILKTLDLFGVVAPPRDSEAWRRAIEMYSKDPTGARRFLPDGARKQSLAFGPLRADVDRWTRRPYEELRRRTCL
jgi:hypothetical protein